MQYRTLGNTGLKVSEIGFGGEWMDGTLEETIAVTRACEDAGINILDCWMPDPTRRSNLGDAQARRLKIRVRGEDGKLYLAHTLNNTVVAPPRMLIAFLENHLHADGSVDIPEVLRPYMGGKDHLEKK